jgi:hypothetical protein
VKCNKCEVFTFGIYFVGDRQRERGAYDNCVLVFLFC